MPSIAIRHRLTAVVFCSLLPIALLGYFFLAQSAKEIDFSAKEDLGTDYIQALMPELVALAKQGMRGSPLPLNPALDDQMAAHDATMNTVAYSAAYRELRHALAKGGDAARARQAAATLVTKIGDGSNLILDPDLDSYYVMDLLVLKLPAAINSAPALLAQLEAATAAPTIAQGELVSLVANLGAFRAMVSGAADSLVAADAGNPDGSVKRNLGKPLESYLTAAGRFGDAIEGASAALGDGEGRAGLELGAVAAAHAGFQDAALAYWQAIGAEMKRLLGIRLSGFKAKLWTAMSISAVLVALVLLLSFLLARSIVKAISRLEADIRSLADGADRDIAHARGRDEISAIARAVAYLRDKTIERLLEADSLKSAERQRADDARRRADEERLENERARDASAAEQRRAAQLIGAGLERLAQGDLSCRIDQPFGHELDPIRVAYNDTVERFANVIAGLRDASRALKVATGELLAGTNDLSDRTTRQAATIDEISTTTDQLAAAILGNADRASSASDTARGVTRAAEDGGAVMQRANEAMERITASSAKISSIIGLIDDIAFQTNLLALNASVEAARAGEAGKGFAVVAVEVRRLAQSAAEASKDIKSLIEQSAGEVEGGSRLVADAAARLALMLDSARSNTEMMDAIARDSHAQAASIAEVNEAVRQMHEMTQHNASLVEETNAAIGQTETQARELDRIVDVFALRSDDAARPVAAPKARRAAGGLQERVRSLAGSDVSDGNTAIEEEWSEF
jgi:methyl-accepting chemotaxis protein